MPRSTTTRAPSLPTTRALVAPANKLDVLKRGRILAVVNSLVHAG
ncbi:MULTISPECIES: hypothetical protein [unclassified Cryobacterium]|nr:MULTISPECIES: hypothetical protein [unclassified Cryobacterium]MDY7528902.1 hypothetical protein [Cryobacterium sp. 10C2]MDY7558932.1 hypothetical protein [Cryobacterium sp. 10C3]MEB0200711.1 hypothetical protein [Cryobacterium sp. 5I3]MEB0292558.1 hypothetical protein [Cryobacterium sp. 10C2]